MNNLCSLYVCYDRSDPSDNESLCMEMMDDLRAATKKKKINDSVQKPTLKKLSAKMMAKTNYLFSSQPLQTANMWTCKLYIANSKRNWAVQSQYQCRFLCKRQMKMMKSTITDWLSLLCNFKCKIDIKYTAAKCVYCDEWWVNVRFMHILCQFMEYAPWIWHQIFNGNIQISPHHILLRTQAAKHLLDCTMPCLRYLKSILCVSMNFRSPSSFWCTDYNSRLIFLFCLMHEEEWWEKNTAWRWKKRSTDSNSTTNTIGTRRQFCFLFEAIKFEIILCSVCVCVWACVEGNTCMLYTGINSLNSLRYENWWKDSIFILKLMWELLQIQVDLLLRIQFDRRCVLFVCEHFNFNFSTICWIDVECWFALLWIS